MSRPGENGNGEPARGSAWGRAFDAVLDAGAALAAVLLLGVMLVTSIKVIFRYGFHEGLIGVDQISGTMLLYITFLGAAWVLRREEHVSIDLLITGLRPRVRRRLDVVTSIIGAAVCLVVAFYGTQEAFTSWQRGIRIAAELEMLRVINLAVIPLGCLCLGLQFLRRARARLRGAAPSEPRG